MLVKMLVGVAVIVVSTSRRRITLHLLVMVVPTRAVQPRDLYLELRGKHGE